MSVFSVCQCCYVVSLCLLKCRFGDIIAVSIKKDLRMLSQHPEQKLEPIKKYLH